MSMDDYKIKLLPDDPERIEESRKEVMRRTERFIQEQLNRGATKKGLDQSTCLLIQDLYSTRFWGVLGLIDGFKIKAIDSTKHETLSEDNRRWAEITFHEYELADIANIAVNQALLKPKKTCWPGTRRAHSVIYEEFFEKEGSKLRAMVDSDLEKRLQNGRFWESLARCDTPIVNDVLANHFDKLEPEFAPKGADLLKEAADNRAIKNLQTKMQYLSDKALNNYTRFLQNLDEAGTAPAEIVDLLVKEYLAAALAWDNDLDMPYFYGKRETEGDESRPHYTDLLKAPIVQKKLADSPEAQTHITKLIKERMLRGDDCYGTTSIFVKDVLDNIPDSDKIMRRLTETDSTARLIKFFVQSERRGEGLAKYLHS